MVILGMGIVIGTIYLLIRQHEVRMVLCGSGFLMGIIGGIFAGNILVGFDAFAKNMVLGATIETICSVMGFAYVMKITECDKHLIHALGNTALKLRALIIPFAIFATFFVNMALPSAAGAAAAVGSIFIPILISAGVHPAVAASCILTGLWGSLFNPGSAHNPFMAKITGMTVPEVIAHNAPAIVITTIVAAVVLTLVAIVRGEQRGFAPEQGAMSGSEHFKVNPVYAFVPLLPLTLLLLSNMNYLPVKVGVATAMIIGSITAIAATRSDPSAVTKQFFQGLGDAYGGIIGIIIAAGVFVAGMTSMGLIAAFVELMKNSTSVVKFAAAFGPFLLGLFGGSGDAAAFAFNGSISPQAPQFGLEIIDMAAVATLCGSFGHKMCPIAGSTIIVAGLAGVSPFDVTRRMVFGAVAAVVTAMVLLLFLPHGPI